MSTESLKPGWQMVKFGDVVRQCKESVDRDNNPFERYVEGGHMNTEDLHIRQWGEFGDDYVGPAFHRIFRKGQVLYGSRRTYLKKVAVAEFDGITANTTFVCETRDQNVFMQELLPFLMLTDAFTEHSIRESKGSTNPYINWPDIAKFEFPLPPLDEQKRIAEILWAADDVIEKFLCTKAQLNETIASIFKNLVITSNPDVKRISELGGVVTGSTPPTKNPEYYSNQEYMFVSPADIGADKYVNKTEKMVSTLGFLTGREIPQNAVMVVCIGSTTGKVAMASEKCITNQQINTVICDEKANPDFVYRTFKMMEDLFYRQASCTALPILNKSQFSSIEILLPSIDKQRHIVEKINVLEAAANNLDEHIANTRVILRQLKEGGSIDV